MKTKYINLIENTGSSIQMTHATNDAEDLAILTMPKPSRPELNDEKYTMCFRQSCPQGYPLGSFVNVGFVIATPAAT